MCVCVMKQTPICCTTFQTQEAASHCPVPLNLFAGVLPCVEIKPDVTCICEQSLPIVVIFMSV